MFCLFSINVYADDIGSIVETENQNVVEVNSVNVYNIEKRIIGHGTVNVDTTSEVGKEVTFVATPKENFILRDGKVTQKNGVAVKVKDNKFVMPEADVIVEVSFVPKNPNTSDLGIVTLMIISFLVIIVTIHNYKKIEWLR